MAPGAIVPVMKKHLVLVCCLISLVVSPAARADFEHFITVDGVRLMDGDEPFRFIAFNVPTLFYVEDEMSFEQTNPYGLPTEFEWEHAAADEPVDGNMFETGFLHPVPGSNQQFFGDAWEWTSSSYAPSFSSYARIR